MRRIGVDVGGTNTDAVLVQDDAVLAAVKTPTTEDVLGGIRTALSELVEGAGDTAGGIGEVEAVMIGTTHFTNAVAQRRGLARVGAVRIGLPSGGALGYARRGTSAGGARVILSSCERDHTRARH